MKKSLAVLGLLVAVTVRAQGGVAVKETTGDLGYTYLFDLPAARGKVQPPLALVYSSGSKVSRGYGFGWDLTTFYVEPDPTAVQYTQYPMPDGKYYVLVRGEKRDRFFHGPEGTTWESNREGLRVEKTATSNGIADWTISDGDGRKWLYKAACGQRLYLAAITDADGNRAAFEYTAEGTCSAARLAAVYYNVTQVQSYLADSIGDRDLYATRIGFDYLLRALGTPENRSGAWVPNGLRLSLVSVEGPARGANSERRKLKTYSLEYGGQIPFESIVGIQECGLSGACQEPTTFTYDQSVDLSLAEAVPLQGFPSTDSFELGDLDGDGLADLKMGTTWARSVSVPGGTPTFSTVQDLLRSSSGATIGGASSGVFLDFDGDGVTDFLSRQAPECPNNISNGFGNVLVRFGKADPAVGVSFDSAVCLDRENVEAEYTGYCGDLWPSSLEQDNCLLLRDVNGDGVRDHLVRIGDAAWSVYLSRTLTGSWRSEPWGTIENLAGEVLLGAGGAYSGVELEEIDLNGDGLLDALTHHEVPLSWPGYGSAPATEYATPAMLSFWPDNGGDRGIYLSMPWPAELPFDPATWGPVYPDVLANGTVPVLGAACQTRVKDPRIANWTTLDVNGDDIPDWLRQMGTGVVGLTFSGGALHSAERTVASSGSLVPRGRFVPTPYAFTGTVFSPTTLLGRACVGSVVLPGVATPFVSFADVNGDGVPDYVSKSQGQGASFSRGSLLATDTNGQPAGAMPLARPSLLRYVRSPTGGVVEVKYGNSRAYGVIGDARPVVTEIQVTGLKIPSSRVRYHYQYGSVYQLRTGWAGAARENTGFEFTYVLDVSRGWLRKTTWNVSDARFRDLATTVEEGPGEWVAGAPAPTRTRLSAKVSTVWSTCGDGAAVTATTVTSTRYLLASPGQLVGFGTQVTTSCADVACDGSVGRSVTREFVDPDGAQRIWGSAITTERKVYLALHHGNWRNGDSDPTWCEESPCAGVGNVVTTEVYSGEGTSKLTLSFKGEEYEPGTCRKKREYVGDGKFLKNYTHLTEAGGFGLLESVSTPDVKTTFQYDAARLRLLREETEEAGVVGTVKLEKTHTYDPDTGWLLSTTGPRLTDSTYVTTRYFVYDAFGRKIATAKDQPLGGGSAKLVPAAVSVTKVVEAAVFDDTPSAQQVKQFRFAAPSTVSFGETGALLGEDSDSSDALMTVTESDELDRTLRVRERLGTSGAAGTSARQLQGWRVVTETQYDAAGRPVVSWEPYFVGAGGRRATVTQYDDEGRASCVVSRYVPPGTSPDPATTTCAARSTNGSDHQAATKTTYAAQRIPGYGHFDGWFMATIQWSPLQLEQGGSPSKSLSDPTGDVVGTEDAAGRRTWIERDELGREIASWREQVAGLKTSPVPATTRAYDPDTGQIVQEWDVHSGPRVYEYDTAGRLLAIHIGAGGRRVQYTYNQANSPACAFGRVSKITEHQADGAESAVTRFFYELPYFKEPEDPNPALEYRYTAGKLSHTTREEVEDGAWRLVTTIAYSYDEAGRLDRRDQWFAGLERWKRFTVDSTYGGDGRVVESRFVNPYDATPSYYRYALDYDSAGRPIGVRGYLRDDPTEVKLYSVVDSGTTGVSRGFDALGRPYTIRADDSAAVSVRTYNAYSGNLSKECKRIGSELECAGTAPPTQADLFRTDAVEAEYAGGLLKSYRDVTSDTNYAFTYSADGKLVASNSAAMSTSSPLRQSREETYTYDELGNIRTARTKTADVGTVWTRDWTETVESERHGTNAILDRPARILTTPNVGTAPAQEPVAYAFDALNRLVRVTRGGVEERLTYGPSGELVSKQVGDKIWFYVGEYATVTATMDTGACGTMCMPLPTSVVVDAHVIFAGTRIASARPSRTLYYYRSRLGTVVATSVGGGQPGARYRYTPYGVLDRSSYSAGRPIADQESELGYTNALRLGGTDEEGRFTSSLLHLKARAYDPVRRLFLQADSVDRQRYAYVNGDPINAMDPSGRSGTRDGVIPVVWYTDWDAKGNAYISATFVEAPDTNAAEFSGADQAALSGLGGDLARFSEMARMVFPGFDVPRIEESDEYVVHHTHQGAYVYRKVDGRLVLYEFVPASEYQVVRTGVMDYGFVFVCRKPLDLLGGTGQRSGPDSEYNPLYHAYLGTFDGQSFEFAGKGSANGKPLGEGAILQDWPSSAGECAAIGSGRCFVDHVKRAMRDPGNRGYYNLLCSNCQDWVYAQVVAGRQMCL